MKRYIPGQLYNENPILRRATGKDKKTIDKVLEYAGVVKQSLGNIVNNKITDNIQKLKEEGTVDLQKAKADLRSLNEVAGIQKAIETQYDNNREAYFLQVARDKFNRDAIASNPNLNAEEMNKLLKMPPEGYGENLNKYAKELTEKYDYLVENLEELGIPYRDLEAGTEFLDDSYEAVFSNMTRENKFKLTDSIGSFLRGGSIHTVDYNKLKDEMDSNVFSSQVSKLDRVNNLWKSLYSISPELANQFSNTVKNTKYSEPIGTPTQKIKDLGNGQFSITVSQAMKDPLSGNFSTKTFTDVITNEEEKNVVQKQVNYREVREAFYDFLTSQGQIEFDKKLLQYDTAFEAWTNLDDKYKLSQEQIMGRDSYYRNLNGILQAYQKDKELNWFVTNPLTRESEPNLELKAWIEGGRKPEEKPFGYYETPKEYATALLGIDVSFEDINLARSTSDTEPRSRTTSEVIGNAIKIKLDDVPEDDVGNSYEVVKEAVFNKDEQKISQMQEDYREGKALNGVDVQGNYFGGSEIIKLTPAQLMEELPNLKEPIEQAMINADLMDAQEIVVGFNLDTEEIVLKDAASFSNDLNKSGSSEEETQFDKRRRILEDRLEQAKFLGKDKKVSFLENQLEELGIIESRAKTRDENLEKKRGGLMVDKFTGRKIAEQAISQVAMGNKNVERFLIEIANIESKFGRDKNTFKGASKGIFQIDPIAFEEVQRRLKETNEKDGGTTRAYNEKLKQDLNLDLSELTYEDLDKPLVGAAFARAYLLGFAEAIPETVLGRAKYWKKYYNTDAGKGTDEKYLKENSVL